MKAILLSAGLGTRLRPLTKQTPKCLVEIDGRPLLDYWLEPLFHAGVREFVINTHHLADKVREFVEHSAFKKYITLFHEEELLGTAGTLLALSDFCKDEDTLIAHADNLCLCNWQNFFSSHHARPKECLMSMMLFETDTPKSCGIVKLQNAKVVEFHEKVDNPPSNLANSAVYCVSPDFIKHVENEAKNNTLFDISLDIIPTLMNKISTWQNDDYLRDIGTYESLSQARQDIKNHPPIFHDGQTTRAL